MLQGVHGVSGQSGHTVQSLVEMLQECKQEPEPSKAANFARKKRQNTRIAIEISVHKIALGPNGQSGLPVPKPVAQARKPEPGKLAQKQTLEGETALPKMAQKLNLALDFHAQ